MKLSGFRVLAAAMIVLATGIFTAPPASGAEDYITMASTTSTRDSGLLDTILPMFEEKTGIAVRVVAVGTGQAIRLAKNGDADVLLVHHRPSEDAFVADGYGTGRRDVMFNDFVIVGPKDDPARIRGMVEVTRALAKIADVKATFVSRGDDSGTHQKERGLSKLAGIDATGASGGWYRETGSGMGATLNAAAAMNGYTLTDRGTWLAFNNKADLKILVEGDERILNPYGVILVSQKRHAHIKAAAGQTFIDWLTSTDGQQAIANFRVNGEKLFVPNAK